MEEKLKNHRVMKKAFIWALLMQRLEVWQLKIRNYFRNGFRGLAQAYFYSAATLNNVRALLDGGFADLHHPQHWDLGFVRSVTSRAEYEGMLDRMLDSLNFVESTGVRGSAAFRTVEFYASHEGLLLPYEEAMTVEVGKHWYNLGAHMLWIGERTRQLNGAHVEYFRGIENPVGIKVGPSISAAELVELIRAIEPANREGRVMLITRLGASAAGNRLPELIAATREHQLNVVWACDPMHGNTITTESGYKTRRFDSIREELRQTFEAHHKSGSHLSGVHIELTGADVTECVGETAGVGCFVDSCRTCPACREGQEQ